MELGSLVAKTGDINYTRRGIFVDVTVRVRKTKWAVLSFSAYISYDDAAVLYADNLRDIMMDAMLRGLRAAKSYGYHKKAIRAKFCR